MKKFHTRQVANRGVRLDLVAPDGKATEYWLDVVGIDSDIFRNAQREVNKTALLHEIIAKAAADGKGTPAEVQALTEAFHENQKLTLLAHLVTGWNFTEDDGSPTLCNVETVKAFFTEAPQIADMVDRIAASRAYFLAYGSKVSTNGASENLGCAESPKVQS